MRAPFQILAFPFIKEPDNYYYAIFKRRDFNIWQALSGGGEGDENPIEAMKREAYEEAQIDKNTPYLRLSSVTTIPAAYVSGLKWGDVIMIPEITFGIEVPSRELTISSEHTEYAWLNCKDATEKLKYDSNKSALWELDYRLNNGREGVEKNIQSVGKFYLPVR